jgi:hypothetical protein
MLECRRRGEGGRGRQAGRAGLLGSLKDQSYASSVPVQRRGPSNTQEHKRRGGGQLRVSSTAANGDRCAEAAENEQDPVPGTKGRAAADRCIAPEQRSAALGGKGKVNASQRARGKGVQVDEAGLALEAEPWGEIKAVGGGGGRGAKHPSAAPEPGRRDGARGRRRKSPPCSRTALDGKPGATSRRQRRRVRRTLLSRRSAGAEQTALPRCISRPVDRTPRHAMALRILATSGQLGRGRRQRSSVARSETSMAREWSMTEGRPQHGRLVRRARRDEPQRAAAGPQDEFNHDSFLWLHQNQFEQTSAMRRPRLRAL